jgi:hypothetical protein
MTPASVTMTPTTRRFRPWMNVAGTAKRKIAPATTKAMPTPVLITCRQPTGWTRPGLFTETDSSVSDELTGGKPVLRDKYRKEKVSFEGLPPFAPVRLSRYPAGTQKTPVPALRPPYSRGKLPGSGATFSRYIVSASNVNGPGQPGAKARRTNRAHGIRMNLSLSNVRRMRGTQSMVAS